MKNFNLLLVFIIYLLFISCTLDNDNSSDNNIELSEFVKNNYTNDAKQLYMHEIFNDTSHPNYNETSIDETEVNKILQIIQAVYNLDIPETDTIFNQNNIHTYLCYSFNALSLKVDTEIDEINNLAEGIIPTGNSNLDNILSNYNFNSVEPAFSYPSFPWLTINFNGEFNMIPINNELATIHSIILTEMSSICFGDGNNITLTRNNNNATIIFSIGSGDCPAGCIYHKYWKFEVVNNTATFIRMYEN